MLFILEHRHLLELFNETVLDWVARIAFM